MAAPEVDGELEQQLVEAMFKLGILQIVPPGPNIVEEQARQMFEAAAEGTESLEEFLQQIMVFPAAPPAEDW